MVFPQSNLPGEAVPWGRALQSAVEETGSSVEVLKQDFLSNNRSLAGQLGVVGRQIEELETQQNEISAVVNFLVTQGDFDQRSSTWQLDRAPVVNSSISWQVYNTVYDPSIYVTAPESGSIRVDLSARLTAVAITYRGDAQPSVVETDTFLGFDVLEPTSSFLNPSEGNSLMLRGTATGNGNNDINIQSLSGFFWVTGLTPGVQYQIRARRGLKGNSQNSPDAGNSQQAFSVMNAKMTTTRML